MMTVLNRDLIVLETYPSRELPYDGLSGVFDLVKDLGAIRPDTSDIAGARVLVCGVPPLYDGKISSLNTNIIFTTFESDTVPPAWVLSINRYQHCVVPHEAIREVFKRSGVTVPISVVHQGYRRLERRSRDALPAECFNVGFLGIPVGRKNLLSLYEACRQLQQSAIPQLKLHVHVSSIYEWLDAGPFERMQEDGMVIWTSGRYSESQISEWYRKLSCYIFPSSGEGWSFTPRESMYLGIPTILSDIPVHQELTEKGFCKVISASGTTPADFGGIQHGSWARITVEDIMEAILDVYRRYPYFSSQAGKGAAWIEHKWMNQDIAQQLLGLVESL
jgi:glycosyltransferase involved in cell wall biosynthesis